MYVVEGLSKTKIKEETGVSLQTLGKWSDFGDWDKKRAEHLENETDLVAILAKIKKKLAKELLAKLEKGEIDTQGLHVLNNLLRATSGKQYDDAPDKQAEKTGTGITQETADKLRDMILNG